MFGYLLLPILIVQHLGFEDLPLMPQYQQRSFTLKPNRLSDQILANTIELQGVHAIGTLKPANQNYETQQQDQHQQQQPFLWNDVVMV